jgi:hypothetical protein
VVKNSITDGQVCDWVRINVNKSESDKKEFNTFILNRGRETEGGVRERLDQRKKDCGLAHRADIQTFVDFIDADEKRI